MGNSKNSVRQMVAEAAGLPLQTGKLAEILRKQDIYRQSSTLFVSPAPQLQQIRINALLDGKVVMMPGPAIKKGFYLLKPYAIPFKDLGYAVSLKGLELFGKLLTSAAVAKIHIDLALTDCLAVDSAGGRLGHGTGFFDLAMGILGELGSVDGNTVCGAVGLPEQLVGNDLPQDSWDVRLHFFLTSTGLRLLNEGDGPQVQVVWEALEKKQIRKIEPLWQLYQTKFPT